MSKLSDDERNLLRYYAETERILHGPVLGCCAPALAVRLRSGVAKTPTPDLLWHDPGWARQTRGGVSGATAVRQLGSIPRLWQSISGEGKARRSPSRRGAY